MLHRLGSVFFLISIIIIIFKNFKIINKKLALNLHIITGAISTFSMIIYSVLDFIKDKEATILLVGLSSALIVLSGTNKVKQKYKYLHIMSVIFFVCSLSFHIIR